MKNKYKKIIVKLFIVLSLALMLISIYYSLTLEHYTSGSNKFDYYEKLTAISFLTFSIIGIITIILMIKIDIRPEKSKPQKYKIRINSFEEFMNYLSDKIKADNYQELELYKYYLYEMYHFIKNTKKEAHIIGIIRIPELTQEIYESFEENYFQEFGEYLIENKKIDVKNDIHVTYIICVDKVNDVFTKYTQRNVKQYFRRYNLPIGISFGSKTLYMATQESGFGKSMYKKEYEKFLEFIQDILIDNKKSD